MVLALLPLVALVTGETTALSSPDEVASALVEGVRSALADGWTLVDVRRDEAGVALSLEKGGAVQRHVAAFEFGFHYRVEAATLPRAPVAPGEFLLEALRRGGIELDVTCGVYEITPFLVEDSAAGARAGDLAARWLATADDLEHATLTSERAVFQLEVRGRAVDLIAALGEGGTVAAIELRRYEARADNTSYRRRRALGRALRGAFVASIVEIGGSVVLGTNRGRFAIDPEGTAFRTNPRTEAEACGC